MEEFKGDFRLSTGPQQLDLAIHTLEGLIKGIAIDSSINQLELETLNNWISEHILLKKRHPFNELIPKLSEVIEDRVIDESEKSDIIWLCRRLHTDNIYYNEITSDLQRLQGILGGIIADGVILKQELVSLENWLEEHRLLKTCWPYDEVTSLVAEVLKDGKIDQKEHEMLLNFFDEFISYPGYKPIVTTTKKDAYHIIGICATNPNITIEGKEFCFAGAKTKKDKRKLVALIKDLGCFFTENIKESTHYLVIGCEDNPTWAFACYGRKVEEAIELRKERQRLMANGDKKEIAIQIVHESDFRKTVRVLED